LSGCGAVVYYRPGQIHVLLETHAASEGMPPTGKTSGFDVAVPSGGDAGWLALNYTPLKPGQYAYGTWLAEVENQ